MGLAVEHFEEVFEPAYYGAKQSINSSSAETEVEVFWKGKRNKKELTQ